MSTRQRDSLRVLVCPRVLRFGSLAQWGKLGKERGAVFQTTRPELRQPKGNREAVLSLQAQALEGLKNLLGSEVSCHRKWSVPEWWSTSLPQKKRELDKRQAYAFIQQEQYLQMNAEMQQQWKRLAKHEQLQRDNLQQVDLLAEENEDTSGFGKSTAA